MKSKERKIKVRFIVERTYILNSSESFKKYPEKIVENKSNFLYSGEGNYEKETIEVDFQFGNNL
jgi:hypothetical protein